MEGYPRQPRPDDLVVRINPVERQAATQRRYPGMTGYSARNLWRMSQFFQIYHGEPKLSPLVRELPWTYNLLIHPIIPWGGRFAGLRTNPVF